ncbi:hypothetical protein BKN14_01540 [Candidatus Gracilibacteria bacterium HOT-871]|nr:hypothetical protein BKN14_01540 [Candidatus Gracilibacteria bacterium HOT-871]
MLNTLNQPQSSALSDKLLHFTKDFETYIQDLKNILQKPKSGDISFVDFDETLYSRIPQFKKDKRFVECRGQAGIDLVYKEIGRDIFLKDYYNPDGVVKDVLSRTDVILTAGIDDLQRGKLEHSGIDKEALVVAEHKQKPKAVLKYVLKSLKSIPENITFIDDKAFDLSEEFRLLSDILQTKIILENIYLDSEKPTEVDHIDKKIFEKGKELVLS